MTNAEIVTTVLSVLSLIVTVCSLYWSFKRNKDQDIIAKETWRLENAENKIRDEKIEKHNSNIEQFNKDYLELKEKFYELEKNFYQKFLDGLNENNKLNEYRNKILSSNYKDTDDIIDESKTEKNEFNLFNNASSIISITNYNIVGKPKPNSKKRKNKFKK